MFDCSCAPRAECTHTPVIPPLFSSLVLRRPQESRPSRCCFLEANKYACRFAGGKRRPLEKDVFWACSDIIFFLNLISCGLLEESSSFAHAPLAKRRPRTRFLSDVGYSLNKPRPLGHRHVFLYDATSCLRGCEAVFMFRVSLKLTQMIRTTCIPCVVMIVNPSRVPLLIEVGIDKNSDIFFRAFATNQMRISICCDIAFLSLFSVVFDCFQVIALLIWESIRVHWSSQRRFH